jgi:hypothetical protein
VRAFAIIRTLEGDLHFVGRNGKVLGKVAGGFWRRPKNRAGP